jgi:hypothetical protein
MGDLEAGVGVDVGEEALPVRPPEVVRREQSADHGRRTPEDPQVQLLGADPGAGHRDTE